MKLKKIKFFTLFSTFALMSPFLISCSKQSQDNQSQQNTQDQKKTNNVQSNSDVAKELIKNFNFKAGSEISKLNSEKYYEEFRKIFRQDPSKNVFEKTLKSFDALSKYLVFERAKVFSPHFYKLGIVQKTGATPKKVEFENILGKKEVVTIPKNSIYLEVSIWHKIPSKDFLEAKKILIQSFDQEQ
ncbi:LIPOPROTEIN [Mycoplasmopsis pulmonis]|uniref:LIPOPROTEIN n=1 Tax=Mycoplasmopsis pulmonis (strain UAB CTIP) TaxID=272635 RepID=Q98QS0_MYCPU|nr:hypothetical protein [Mycoplasmopsis pulmonis]MDZ7293250.1 hypothetical protein [Mycoplasmopsis pulmonis]CAC13464.1 LIPOPROTEIN [Mycoplasmopsis pulmonis]VEU68052.1 Uncharacterised protein [Mycoplasmopsis pulmonis]